MSFVHLHLHTQYSLLDGANKVKELLPRVRAAGMEACAITDHGNLFGGVQFFTEAKKAGVKPILGCELYVAPGSRFEKQGRIDDYEAGGNYHMVALAMDREGYRNLCRLVSAGYREGFHYKPRVDKELLRELNGGLIAFSGCLRGEVPHALMQGQFEKARGAAEELAAIFDGRYYIEIQDNRLEKQEQVNVELKALAKRMGLPLIGTNDCHYLEAADSAAHEVLLCIQTGKTFADERRWKFETDQLYVKEPHEMAAAFPDVPEAISNTLEVARRCNFEFEQRWRFPVYQTPAGETLEEALERAARAGAGRAFEHPPGARARHRRRARLRRAPGLRAGRHQADGLRRLLPDRRGLHQLGEGAGHPGGPGARLGRGQPGGLGAPHHGSRPDRARAAVRAVPQSRAPLHARHRRRLLLRPARRGDPLRTREVWRGSRGADHHVRNPEGEAGHQGRRTRPGLHVPGHGPDHQALSRSKAGP